MLYFALMYMVKEEGGFDADMFLNNIIYTVFSCLILLITKANKVLNRSEAMHKLI